MIDHERAQLERLEGLIRGIESKNRFLGTDLAHMRDNLTKSESAARDMRQHLEAAVTTYRALVSEKEALMEHKTDLQDHLARLQLTPAEMAVVVGDRVTPGPKLFAVIERLDSIKALSTEMLVATDYCEPGEQVARSCDLARQRLFDALHRHVSSAVAGSTKNGTPLPPLTGRLMLTMVRSAPISAKLSCDAMAHARDAAMALGYVQQNKAEPIASSPAALFVWLCGACLMEAQFVASAMVPTPDTLPGAGPADLCPPDLLELVASCLDDIPRNTLTNHLQPAALAVIKGLGDPAAVFEAMALAESLPRTVAEANAAAISSRVDGTVPGLLDALLAHQAGRAVAQFSRAVLDVCMPRFDALLRASLPLPVKQVRVGYRGHQPSARFMAALALYDTFFATIRGTLGPEVVGGPDARGVGLALTQYSNALLQHASTHSAGRDPILAATLMCNCIVAMQGAILGGLEATSVDFRPLEHVVALLEEQVATYSDLIVSDELDNVRSSTNMAELAKALGPEGCDAAGLTGLNVIAGDALGRVRAALTDGFDLAVVPKIIDRRHRLALQARVEAEFVADYMRQCRRLLTVGSLAPEVRALMVDKQTLERVYGYTG